MAESDLGSTATVLRAVTSGGDTGGLALHQKQSGLARQLGGHQKRIGLVAHGHHAFAATDLVSALGLGGRRLRGFERVARGPLLVGQHHQGFAAGNAGQPGFGFGTAVTRHHGTGNQSLGQGFEHHAPAQFFHDHHGLDRPHAHAAVAFGHEQGGQAEFGQFVVHITGKTTGFDNALAALEGVAFFHPLAGGVAQLLLVFAEVKIHLKVS